MRYKHIGYKLDGYYKMVDLAHKYLNMSKSTKHKLKAIQHWEKYGILSSKDAFEISTSTLYRWNKLYHDYGLNGLQDKSKAPIRRKRRSAIWDARVIKFIRNYRHEHLLCGAHKIARPLQEYCTANDISCPVNAICERFNRTIKEGCLLPNMSYMINEQPNFYKNLANWLYWYNTERAHYSLEYNTPMEKLNKAKNSHMLWDHTIYKICYYLKL